MSTALSANLTNRSLPELLALREKLSRLREARLKLAELERSEFRRRYPTPGALAQALQPSTRQTPALDAIDAALVDLADAPDDRGRQMIFVPPQEGKSTRASCWFPLWLLAQDPTLRIAIISYSLARAVRWGRWIRRMITSHPELGIELQSDSRAVDNFETTAGGRVICVGMGGGITGEPVDVEVVDDPLRGRAEAESPTYREAAKDWWESNGSTRLSSRGRVVLMLTRWHSDDLAGWLLKAEPGAWKVLRIPAVREPGTPPVRGADGASVYAPNGELISVQNRRPGYYLELKHRRSLYVWNSIFQQTPVAAEGNLFRREDFRYWQPMQPDRGRHDATGGRQIEIDGVRHYLGDCTRFITMDLAASKKTSADWTVASVWAITMGGLLVLLDRERARIEETDHWSLVKPLVRLWAAPTVYVEKGFIGSTMVIDATRAGVHIEPVTPDTDKVTRALPATHRIKAHTVWFPARAEWLDEWCDELAGFPTAEHDDQVDTLAYAARVASAHWMPPLDITVQRDHASALAVEAPLQRAYEAATGIPGTLDLGFGGLDY
jgi:predicted phage terminase large subunit-like protein